MTYRTRGPARGALIIAVLTDAGKETACTNEVVTVHTLSGCLLSPENFPFQISTVKA